MPSSPRSEPDGPVEPGAAAGFKVEIEGVTQGVAANQSDDMRGLRAQSAHGEEATMAPEYLAPGVFIEETSVRAPTKADLAFGAGRSAAAPEEQNSAEGPDPAKLGGDEIYRTLRGEPAELGGEDVLASPAGVEPTAFNGGHIEEEILGFTYQKIEWTAVEPVESVEPDPSVEPFDG